MKDIDKNGYMYLGFVETDKIKEKGAKEKFIKECLRRLRLTLKSKLNERNKIIIINTWAESELRYGSGILKRNTEN